MTLTELNTDLALLLPTWNGGGWKDLSILRNGDPVMRLGRGTVESPGTVVYESDMSEHSMTVVQVLDVFSSGANAVRVMKQYTKVT